MRRSFQIRAIVLCIVFIISSSTISARLLQNKEGQEEAKLKKISDGLSLVELEGSDFMNLMGLEACVDGDEDCVKRRVIAEAHLDYIYTQNHKP
ncbi:putative phytosulfokines 6 [Argentina anserina]|uniref:putative phytosulfokines 6 n=1 Tax=Argentina anserina TaxID=57926 RepID=UPI00217694D2|nr:putative phytosulfokines 6 [Potentilla anserina]